MELQGLIQTSILVAMLRDPGFGCFQCRRVLGGMRCAHENAQIRRFFLNRPVV